MAEIIIDENLIKEIYEYIKLTYPDISIKEAKEYIRIAILMMYKNKEKMKIHAHKKAHKKEKTLKEKVYTITLKKDGKLKPIWMMAN